VATDVGPDGADDLAGALAEVARLSRIVDGLLLLARPGAAVGAGADAVDVAAVARERCAAWAPLADERGVRIRVEGDGSAWAAARDDRVGQVLDNLLANALDAAPEGTDIVLRVESGADGPVIHVEDAGPGMTDDERAHAFDRFWRASSAPTGRLGGSGLGLAIVQKLVNADGGDVVLEARAGGGIDAAVRLPASSTATPS
jgi:signal transduction histidine kinase